MKHWMLLGLTLAACSPEPPQIQPRLITGPTKCGAENYQDLVGQDATALEKVLILGPIRIIRPDTVVTTDFREDRINFRLSAGNLVTQVACG